MPVFFFVGGYANVVGWRAARRDHTPYPTWLRERLRRLILPAIPVLAFWAPVAAIAWRSGVDPDLIAIASQAALVPTWFLATYVLIVALTPAHRRTVGASRLVGDHRHHRHRRPGRCPSLGLGVHAAAWVNYVFVWNAVHMLGYAWADDRIGTVRTRLAMAAGGVVGPRRPGDLRSLPGGDGRARQRRRDQLEPAQGDVDRPRSVPVRARHGDGGPDAAMAERTTSLDGGGGHQRLDHEPLPVASDRDGGGPRRWGWRWEGSGSVSRSTVPPGG
jgi:hypothetical protein